MATTGDNRSISIDRGDVIGSTVISGNGNIVVLQAAGLVRDEPQDQRAADAKIGPNPYKGLLAFHEEDAERFFGREVQIDRLWQMFRDLHDPPPRGESPLRLLPVLGPSGSGKSSVARAGLIPELARRPLPGWKKARVAVLTPGSHPLEALAAVLARIATGDAAPVKKTREFVDELKLGNQDSRCSLREQNAAEHAAEDAQFAERTATIQHDGLRRIAAALPEIASTPLIVLVDQFEEIYSLCADADERNAFVENLLCAVSDPAANVSAIITLRTDFLGETQKHPQLNAAIAGQGAIIPAMNEDELRQAIAEPAKLAGRPLDEATVDLLIHETEGREGALPLLQFALTRIWEGLLEDIEPADTLKKIGGVGGALAGEAQRIYDNLLDEEKNIARRVFLGLVQLGEGTRDTRRRVIVGSLVAVGEDPDQVEEVVRRFSAPGVRLITLSAASDGNETAEVTHEALFEHWRKLDEWLAHGRDDQRFQRRLEQAANDWDGQDRVEGLLWRPPNLELLRSFKERPGNVVTKLQREFYLESERGERMRKRRNRWIQQGFAILGIAGLVLAATSIYFFAQARRQARIAVNAQNAADSHWLVTGSPLDSRIWDLTADPANAVVEFEGHLGGVECLAISADNHWLVTGSGRKARIWDLMSADPQNSAVELIGHTDSVSCLAISADNHWLVTGSRDSTARIWDLTVDDPANSAVELTAHAGPVSSVAISADDHTLVTGSRDSTARIWDLTADEPSRTTGGVKALTSYQVRCVAISPDNHRLIIGSNNDTANNVRIWDLTAANLVELKDHNISGKCLAISPDNRWLITGNDDKKGRIWDLTADDPSSSTIELKSYVDDVSCMAISPNNQWLVTGSYDMPARLWNLTADDPTTSAVELKRHADSVTCVAISPNSHWLVTGGFDDTARLWDLTVDEPANSAVELGHGGRVTCLAISSDNHWLVTGSYDKTARLWDLTVDDTTTSALELVHDGRVWCVAMSPDNHWLVTGSKTARIWNLTAEDVSSSVVELKDHRGSVDSVAISEDSHWLVTGSDDGTVRIWDLTAADPTNSSVELKVSQQHKFDRIVMPFLAISADNRWLVTGNINTVSIWPFSQESLTKVAQPRAGRNMTHEEWRHYFPTEAYDRTFSDLPAPLD